MTAPQFNPVEAQQAIKVARDYLQTMGPLPARLVEPLASDLESAVEYIAGLEDQVKGLTEYAEDRLNQQRSVQEYAKGHKHRADNYATANAALEAEVARLNAQIVRNRQVNDSVDSWIELANRYETKLNAVHAYINENEHPDDWGVPCVYTKDLRALLVTPAPTEPEKEN